MAEMNNEEIPKKSGNTEISRTKRPFFLTLIVLFACIFLGLYLIFNLLALFNSRWIYEVNKQYLQGDDSAPILTSLEYAVGVILHLTALTGIYLIWKMRRRGYLIFSGAILIISSIQLFTNGAPVMTTFVNIALLILLGTFYRRFE
jgi:hypothetical protein